MIRKATKTVELLTHSKIQSFKSCRKKCFYSYELGYRKETSGKALRMGHAFHAGVENLGRGADIANACQAVRDEYALCPEGFDPMDWSYELETVLRLVCAYQWRWATDRLEYVAVELPFQIPLINPESGRKAPGRALAGKIDAIVKLEDGRLAIKETKLFGDDIGMDSLLWKRMRIDQQVTLYIHAARELGYDCATVLYDVARKPTVAPTNIPTLDELGVKIVVDREGNRVKTGQGKWRQTGSTEDGYTLLTRPMTTEEWGDKLTADIGERPLFYFNRVEVARLDQDIREFTQELWDVHQALSDAQKNNRWYRTVSKDTCSFCDFFNFCSNGADLSGVPEGFTRLTDKHPELGRILNVNVSTPASESPATAAAPEGERDEPEIPDVESVYW